MAGLPKWEGGEGENPTKQYLCTLILTRTDGKRQFCQDADQSVSIQLTIIIVPRF